MFQPRIADQVGRPLPQQLLAEAYLVSGRPSYFGGFVSFNNKRLYQTWARLIEAVRSNRPVGWDPDKQRSFFDSDEAVISIDFYEAMHSLSTPTGQAITEIADIASWSRLLDLGGGSGAIDIELCKAYPHLHCTVLDLPGVVGFASAKIDAAGLSERIDTVALDLFDAPTYPHGYDVAVLSLIMHSFTEEQDRSILAKCFECLPSGGTLLISELLVNDDKTGPAPAALMSLTMLIEDVGRNYTAAEYTEWLDEAGFREPQRYEVDAPGSNGILIAHKP